MKRVRPRNHWAGIGWVYVERSDSTDRVQTHDMYRPDDARKFAAELIRLADVAEGKS